MASDPLYERAKSAAWPQYHALPGPLADSLIINIAVALRKARAEGYAAGTEAAAKLCERRRVREWGALEAARQIRTQLSEEDSNGN